MDIELLEEANIRGGKRFPMYTQPPSYSCLFMGIYYDEIVRDKDLIEWDKCKHQIIPNIFSYRP